MPGYLNGHAKRAEARRRQGGVKVMALLSVLLRLSVVCAGRLIAYL